MIEIETIGTVLPTILILTVMFDLFFAIVKPPESRLLRRIYFFGHNVALPCLIWISCLFTFAFLLRVF